MAIRIKRIYEPADEKDGLRILVDRVWPRGISRADAKITVWEKDVAPSTDLRKWFGHRPERWPEFRTRYRAELKHNPAVDALRKLVRGKTVTLLYGARDTEHNQAVVLAAFLRPARRKKSARA
ncbi:MAG TPA: DUF488 domain-containing protein [Rhizomicrobium sp.]|nr:DUF488 domain-containing protein [Rhizomicrobium sp.]